MNENEKQLFYRALENNTEEPSLELASHIMFTVHQKARKKAMKSKILEIIGYALLAIFSIVFVAVYLFFYTDFKMPVLQISFNLPSRFYVIIFSIIFTFSLIDLYFRKRMYLQNPEQTHPKSNDISD